MASLWLASHAGICGEGWKTSSPKNACMGGYPVGYIHQETWKSSQVKGLHSKVKIAPNLSFYEKVFLFYEKI